MGANLACCSNACNDKAGNGECRDSDVTPTSTHPSPFLDGPDACEVVTQHPVLETVSVDDKRPSSGQPSSGPSTIPEELNKIKSHPHTRLGELPGDPNRYYLLAQTFALVRHADRLDHTMDWDHYADRAKWPHDTPLTPHGHARATQVGHDLASSGKPFALIISSPYYRCAQTASRIAEVLRIPIHFDLDVGEVFDTVSMGHIDGGPQHRSPKVLKATLAKEFPKVEYVCDTIEGKPRLKVEGKLQKYPEAFAGARMRFCYKVKKLVQRAAHELMSIVIVSHGDALAAVLGMLEEKWSIKEIGYAAYLVASREVRVLQEGAKKMIEDEPVYPERANSWHLTLSPGVTFTEVKSAKKQQVMHAHHTQELKMLEEKANEIKTDYELEVHHEELFKATLLSMGSSDEDMHLLMSKSKSSLHMATEHENRMHCSPHSRSGSR